MSRAELENLLVRAGLTRDQVSEVLAAADLYAQSQCAAALAVLTLPEVIRR